MTRNMLFLVLATVVVTLRGESLFTLNGFHLIGYHIDGIFSTDWLGCLHKCTNNRHCISYNFNTKDNLCQLNDRGIAPCSFPDNRLLTRDQNYIYQQIKAPNVNQLVPQRFPECSCNCGLNQCYPPGPGDSEDTAAASCRSIFMQRRYVESGPYYLALFPSAIPIYCHMGEIPGCGGGGWTLVMKIDGRKSTFRYNSIHWTDKQSYNIEDGQDMSEKETLLSTYWSVEGTKICLGMKNNGLHHWVALNLPKEAKLYDIIKTNHISTNLDIEEWKSLLTNSSLEKQCTRQGFNVHESHKDGSSSARVGILGYSKDDCKGEFSNSRIGFGTSGTPGIDYNYTCGNEAKGLYADNGPRSIPAFGYIFIQ